MARFSYIYGDVNLCRNAQANRSPASINLPLRQGAPIWAGQGERAEIQFDDISRIRLGTNALVTLPIQLIDAVGKFTEITFVRNRFRLLQEP